MWELDCQESWVPKNWCFWAVVFEKTLESPLDCKEIQPVHSKGDQPWVFIGRTDAKAETPKLWPRHAKSWLIGKDSDAGRDWGQEEKGMTEDEMAGWHQWLDGHESEWTSGVGDGQGGLACCSSWGHKESDMTEWLNWTTRVSSLSLSSFPPSPFPLPEESFDGKHISVSSLNPQALFLSFFLIFTPVVLRPKQSSELPAGCVKPQVAGLTPEFLIQQFLGGAWELTF